MPIVNINTLQNKIGNSDYMTTYTDVYLKQSLANLGQRLSVKGDGITSDSFSVSDVFNEYLGDIDSSHIVKVSYNYTDGNINMYLCTYNDGDSNVTVMKNIGTQVPIDYINNIVDLKEDFVLNSANSTINGVDHYAAGSLIIKGNDYYITSAVGLEMSSSSDIKSEDYVAHEYVCDKISNDGELIEGLRIIKANQYVANPVDKQELLMLHLWKNEVEDENKAGYVFDVYKPNYNDIDGYETLEGYIANIINPLCESENRTFISPYFVKNTLAPNSANTSDFFGWSLIQRYSEGDLRITDIPAIPNSLTYNTEENRYWKLSEQYSSILLEDCKQYINLNDVINYFAADTTTWFDTIKQKYNEALYLSNNATDININLKKQIFGALIKTLFNEWISQESTVTENLNVYSIYMPANYTIYYNCNDNDTSIIYNSIKNITVKFEANVLDEVSSIIGEKHSNIIIADSSEIKVGIYSFTITYIDNDTQSGIIDNIEFISEYVLPYVNDNGYWCINDEQTDIFALGSDAGNPNIILTYSNHSTYSIISGVDKDLLETWSWDQHPVRVEYLDRDNNLGDGFYYELNAYLPSNETINSLNPDQFALVSNALVVNFLSPDCETYPVIYNTTYQLNPDKIIYYDFTYDASSAKFIKYSYNQYNDDIINRKYNESGNLNIPEDFAKNEICKGIHIVTSESGDGMLSRLYPSVSYTNTYYMPCEAWNFAYKYVYNCGIYQRNWLRNRKYDYGWDDEHRFDYLNDPENAGTYVDENGNRQYYYDTIMYNTQLTYSYWHPLLYKADYSKAYTAYNEVNKDSLLYKLGDNGVITTFWSIEKNVEKNTYEWTYVKKPDSIFALDSNYINNLDNNIRYYLNHEYQPDNYEHRWLIFEKTNRLLKNNTIDDKSYIYPVIQNKSRDEFISIFGEEKDIEDIVTSTEIYNNDLNFEIAFYDNIEKNNVGDVNSIKQNTRFWKGSAYDFHRLDVISDDDVTSGSYGELMFINNKTFSYTDYDNNHERALSYTGVDGVIHYTLYPNEWVPNGKYDPNDDTYSYQYPTLELKEVMLRDVNTVNRVNVLSFDGHAKNGNNSYMIYNAYFGTSYETAYKNVLIVGTSYRNINMGTETMTTYESTYNLGAHNTLQLNVDNIELNGYSNANKDFIANKAIWKKTSTYIPWTGDSIDVFSTIVQPTDIVYYMGINQDNINLTYNTEYYTEAGTYTVYNSHYKLENSTDASGLVALSYNNYLLSYLNRIKNTQTRYFNSRYLSRTDEVENNNNISYIQTLSYMNVTQLLNKYCSLEIDDGTYIYGDAQHLFSLDTSWSKDNDQYDINSNEMYDSKSSRYAYNRANRTYFMLLTTDLASDENLLFAYNTPKYDFDENGNLAYVVVRDKDNNILLDSNLDPIYEYNTYRFVTTNPIAVTYTNNSYAVKMDYPEERYVYSFTYATSYYMEYTCPGCSLCSSNNCKYIQNCKWSEIVGYFNIGTCIAPVDRKKSSYTYELDGVQYNGKQYIEQLYDERVAYWWFTNEEKTERAGSFTYFADTYTLTYTKHSVPKTKQEYEIYDLSTISYTCWSDDEYDMRMIDMSKPQVLVSKNLAEYNEATNSYKPHVQFKEVGKNSLGNPIYLAFMYSGIENVNNIDKYETDYFTYNGKLNGTNKQYDKTLRSENNSYTICNAYYCHVPVTYYDPIRNLKDTYRFIKPEYIPKDYNNVFGTYLWINAPDTCLDEVAGIIYYATEERDLTYVGSYSDTPNLLVAKFDATLNPVNNKTPNNRGWEVTTYTNIYGEPINGSHYNELYDENKDGKIDEYDYNIYSSKINSGFEGYSKDELSKIKELINNNIEETTYTCYFTYIGEFISEKYAYLSYKCINVRELTTPHSHPYFANGKLLSTNMNYNAVVDTYTYDWNYDKRDRIALTKNIDLYNSYSYPVDYYDINNNHIQNRTVASVNIYKGNTYTKDEADKPQQ